VWVVRFAILVLAGAAAPAAPLPDARPPAPDSLAAVGASADTLAPPLEAQSDSLPLRLQAGPWLAGAGDGRGQVMEPDGVAVDAFGRVYVSDGMLHRLQRFGREGRWLGESGALGSGAGELRRPGSVVTLGALSVAVLDRENRRVQSYDLFGQLLGTVLDLTDPALETVVGRVDPVALAADRGGALYVVDSARERVLAFDGSGRFVRAFGGFGSRPGQFRGLRGLATAPHGELVVTERLNARVQKLDAGGRTVAAWPLALEGGPAARGLPVAVDEAGRIAVADEASGRLWLFDSGGRMLARLEGLGQPRALAFGPGGTLMVATTGPPAVRRFTLVGAEGRAPAGGE
jgi:DNA-binding beta-propeller fold protein YncE